MNIDYAHKRADAMLGDPIDIQDIDTMAVEVKRILAQRRGKSDLLESIHDVVLQALFCIAYRQHGGNKSHMAKTLGITRKTLGKHMRRLGMR